MNDIIKRKGGCACGSVRYQGKGKWGSGQACHCNQCRKQTGSYYMATGIALKDFSITQDKTLRWYKASPHAERGFCSLCGSALFWRSIDDNWRSTANIGVVMGSLDDDSCQGLQIKRHIFTADKKNYYQINDNLPLFEGAPSQS